MSSFKKLAIIISVQPDKARVLQAMPRPLRWIALQEILGECDVDEIRDMWRHDNRLRREGENNARDEILRQLLRTDGGEDLVRQTIQELL